MQLVMLRIERERGLLAIWGRTRGWFVIGGECWERDGGGLSIFCASVRPSKRTYSLVLRCDSSLSHEPFSFSPLPDHPRRRHNQSYLG